MVSGVLQRAEGRKKLEDEQGGEKDLGSSSLYFCSFYFFMVVTTEDTAQDGGLSPSLELILRR